MPSTNLAPTVDWGTEGTYSNVHDCPAGKSNRLFIPSERPPDIDAPLETTERLGGLLRSYQRAA